MKNLSKSKKIKKAGALLDLGEKATLKEVKSHYKDLLKKWHPDKCNKKKAECNEITQKIVSAYKIIIDYIDNNDY